LADGTVKSGALIGRHRKGLLFHPHLTTHRLTALTFFSVALGISAPCRRPLMRCQPGVLDVMIAVRMVQEAAVDEIRDVLPMRHRFTAAPGP